MPVMEYMYLCVSWGLCVERACFSVSVYTFMLSVYVHCFVWVCMHASVGKRVHECVFVDITTGNLYLKKTTSYYYLSLLPILFISTTNIT